MDLKRIETLVKPAVLERGLIYYNEGLVLQAEQIEPGEFIALVAGNKEYNVYLKLNTDFELVAHRCDCPYDDDALCKHRVAALYLIYEEELYRKEPVNGPYQKIKIALNNYSKAELQQLLLDMAKLDRNFRKKLLWILRLMR